MAGGFIDWLGSSSAGITSLMMVVVCTLMTSLNVFMHLMYYNRDDLQRHIIRIVLVVPIYTIASYLEMIYSSLSIATHAIVGFWEALVIYSFFNLILEYVGGEHNWLVCVQRTHPNGLKHMWPINYIIQKPMDLDPGWLRRCKLACFQFVLIKPVFGLLMLPVLIYGSYHDTTWRVIRDVVYNLTYTIAMYALALLYLTTHEHPSLEPKKPLAKFGAVKVVIFFTYWQKYLLLVFGLSDSQLSDLLAFLTMVEMTIMAIPLNWVAYPYWEFKQPVGVYRKTGEILSPMKIAPESSFLELSRKNTNLPPITGAAIPGSTAAPIGPSDKFNQFKQSSMQKLNSVMDNAKKVFSTNDFVDNAEHNILSKYQTHVLLQDSQEYVLEENPEEVANMDIESATGNEGMMGIEASSAQADPPSQASPRPSRFGKIKVLKPSIDGTATPPIPPLPLYGRQTTSAPVGLE